MFKKDHDMEGKGMKAAPSPSSPVVQQRCGSCGMEWKSSQDAEACPLEELEITFFFADWMYSAEYRLIIPETYGKEKPEI
jgi:hypothetical protein